jgi:hypothetical protein
LVQAYHKYKERQVEFVSLTNVSRGNTELFVESFAIPWPCGYGTTLEQLGQFGAYSTDRMSDSYNPGYEVTPTMYLIGTDGQILWHDQQARPHHLKSSAELLQEVDREIERQLGK